MNFFLLGNNNVGVCGRKKSDGEFHDLCERSEFYHMSDLEKSAALFNVPPVEEVDSRFFDPSSISSYEVRDFQIRSNLFHSRHFLSLNLSQKDLVPLNAVRHIYFNMWFIIIAIKYLIIMIILVMIYVRKKDEEFYTALHLVPPTIK